MDTPAAAAAVTAGSSKINSDPHTAESGQGFAAALAGSEASDLTLGAVFKDAVFQPLEIPGLDDILEACANLQEKNKKTMAGRKARRLKAYPDHLTEAEAHRRYNTEVAQSHLDSFETHLGLSRFTKGEHPVRRLAKRRLKKIKDTASDAYLSNPCSTVTDKSKCKTYENALRSAFAFKDGCTFAFRGSDDVGDWLANIAGGLKVSFHWIGVGVKQFNKKIAGTRYKAHGGFVDEFMTLKSKMDADVKTCLKSGKQVVS